MCENESGPRGAGNTTGGLTHSLDYTEEGIAMKATQTARVPATGPVESFRPVVLMDRVLDYIGAHPGCTRPEVLAQVLGKANFLRRALDFLIQENRVRVNLGPRNAHRYFTIEPQPCFVYRYFDADGVLLYVGLTNDPKHRDRSHAKTSLWYRFVARHDVDERPDRPHAEEDERDQILNLRPLFNLVYGRPDRERALVDYLVVHEAWDLLRPAALGEVRRDIP